MYYGRGMSIASIEEVVPISRKTISRWISIFAAEKNISSSMAKSKQVSNIQAVDIKPEKNNNDEVKALKAEIRHLKAELRIQTIRGDLYDEIMGVAERNLGVQIRKKAGTKQ